MVLIGLKRAQAHCRVVECNDARPARDDIRPAFQVHRLISTVLGPNESRGPSADDHGRRGAVLLRLNLLYDFVTLTGASLQR